MDGNVNSAATGAEQQAAAAAAQQAGAEQQAAQQTGNANSGGQDEVTLESVLTQLAELKATNAKLKADNDKLCTSEGNLRKQLRAKQTAEEAEAESKAEQEQQHAEYVKSLERFKAITEATERYTAINMSAELAKATATAEVDGEKEVVTSNINKFLKEREEAMDKQIHAKYAAQMPYPQSGNDGKIDYTAEIDKAIDNLDFHSATRAILQQSQANQSVD